MTRSTRSLWRCAAWPLALAACSGDETADTGAPPADPASACPEVAYVTDRRASPRPDGAFGIQLDPNAGRLGWPQVAGGGVEFALIRASGDPDDACFAEAWGQAAREGIARAPLHRFAPHDDPEAAAEDLLAQLGEDLGELPPVLSVTDDGDWRGANCSQSAARMARWLDAIEDALGVAPLLHVDARTWDEELCGTVRFGDRALILVEHDDATPDLPSGWSGWDLWQYTGAGAVPGAHGDVALVQYTDDLAALLDRFDAAAVYADAAEEPPPRPAGTSAGGDGTWPVWSDAFVACRDAERSDPYDPTAVDYSAAPSGVAFGVDVSAWDGVIDWPRAREAGVGFALVKATDWQDADPCFAYNWAALADVGLPRAAYHLFNPTESPSAQARAFAWTLGGDVGEIQPVLNLEDALIDGVDPWEAIDCIEDTAEADDTADTDDGADGAEAVARVTEWLEVVEATLGVRPMIYLNRSIWTDRLCEPGSLLAWPLWVADWVELTGDEVAASSPPEWGDVAWGVWQYSGAGYVPGIPTAVGLSWGDAEEPTETAPAEKP